MFVFFFKCLGFCPSLSRSLYFTVISRINSNNNAFCRQRNKRKAKWQWVKWLEKTTTCIWITHDSNSYDVGRKSAPFLFIVFHGICNTGIWMIALRTFSFFLVSWNWIPKNITQLSNNSSRPFLNPCLALANIDFSVFLSVCMAHGCGFRSIFMLIDSTILSLSCLL